MNKVKCWLFLSWLSRITGHKVYSTIHCKFAREVYARLENMGAETAKANNLKPYNYFELLLTEIPNHMEDTNLNFLEDLLPWSEKLPIECKKAK